MSPMRCVLLALACCVVPSFLIAQQAPARDRAAAAAVATGTATLSGTVSTDEASSHPIRRVTVALGSSDLGIAMTAVTDDAGRFSFRNLPAGRYTLSASRPGMINAQYGARKPGRPGTALTVADGQHVTNVAIRMLRGAVITGTIRDQHGEPASGIRVAVMRYTFAAQTGEKTLISTAGPLGVVTDDRGVYRAFGLQPDDYVVVASVGIGGRVGSDVHQITSAEAQWAMQQINQPGQPMAVPSTLSRGGVFAPVFYPGTTLQSAAATVTVGPGEERTNIDFALQLVPTSKISGAIVPMDGAPAEGWQIAILSHERITGLPFSGFGTATSNKDGQFTFNGISPGNYSLTARQSPAGARGRGASPAVNSSLFGLIDVTVTDGRDVEVTLPIRSGVTVSGQLIFDGASPPPNLASINLSMSAAPGGTSASLGVGSVKADAQGQFTFNGVTPGRYLFENPLSGNWRLRSAIAQGRDALDVPLDVATNNIDGITLTFTDRPSELTGTLVDATGRAAPEYFVIAFAADKAFWTPQSRRIQQVRPGVDGKFAIRNLPAGEYLLAAVTDVEPGEWFDPSFLQQLAGASAKVALGDGEKKNQDIKIAK